MLNDTSDTTLHASPRASAHTSLQGSSLVRADRLDRRIRKLQMKAKNWSERLERLRNARLASGLTFCALLVVMAVKPALHLELPVFVLFLGGFSSLVVRTRRVQKHLRDLRSLTAFYERQERRCRGLPSGRPHEIAAKIASASVWPPDIGLFGQHSLWSLIDETLTDAGQSRLIDWLIRPPLSVDENLSRQGELKRLRHEAWFFTRWGLAASDLDLSDDFRLSSAQILKFIKKPFVERGFAIWLILNWVAWFAAIAGIVVLSHQKGIDFPKVWPAIWAAFVGVSLLSLMKIGSPFLKGVGLSHHLGRLAPIFQRLEKRAGVSAAIERLAPICKASGPSREARKLNRVLAFMSVQANPLVHLLANGLCPWSITATHFLERRRRKIAYTFPQCIEELAEIEALGSLTLFAHHQTANFPVLQASSRQRPEIAFVGLFHPLLDRARAVANDFAFPPSRSLGLLTGSNMSGKSTFLRTLGLNQVLANMGAPVFAESFITSPLRIETCIEVSDSLRDGFSYFYAEVRRLKEILTHAEGHVAVLYLIDEIFRGTNNRERHIGSRAVVRTLAQTSLALGFVSTHDLELTSLERELPAVMNLHFREDFSTSGEMIFTYRLHDGPCPTTNALKIMEREGIRLS